jgi:signal transduction histidine kinase/GAF domain-containing protein
MIAEHAPSAADHVAAGAALLRHSDESAVLREAAEQARRLFRCGWAAVLDVPRQAAGQERRYLAGSADATALAAARAWAMSTSPEHDVGALDRVLGTGALAHAVHLDRARSVLLVLPRAETADVAAYCGFVRIAAEHARRNATLHDRALRQVDYLNLAAEVGAAIGSVERLDIVLDRIVHHTAAVIDVTVSSVLLLDGSDGAMRIAAFCGVDPPETRVLEADKTATWQAMRERRPFEVLDGQTDERFPMLQAFARRAATHTCLSVPLVARDRPIGSLDVHRDEVRHFGPDDVRLMQIVASQAAVAIENARLYGAIAHERRLLAATVQGMRDGLILEDASGRVLYVNEVAGSLLGCGVEELHGMNMADVYRRLAGRAVDGQELEAQLVATARRHDSQGTLDLCLDNTQQTDLRVGITPTARDEAGPGWYLHLWRDVRWERAADRAKSVLLSTVSHELHTPLTNIKGFVTSLLSEDVTWDATTQRDFLREVDAETDHLSGLVDNLLDMSRLEAGVLQIKKRWTELPAVVEKVVRHARLRAGDCAFAVDLPQNLPPVFVDPVRIGEVLRNLLDNAVKYAGPGEVRIAADCQAGEVVIAVIDQGPGVPADVLGRLFERFYRFVPQGKQIPGTGLGLAICRGLVEAHGGRIWAESDQQGTRVRFALPLLADNGTSEDDEPPF